ncbi:MAG: tRNA (N6-threonylcarbamoyladenosine(37)-N6)-methyltransferase TrmO [Ruminococcaceae bacterium]|nr:tRNA (N6-threonylcarbamoyladenosine(37)-N6)-methyltransferase TrmO [Oscillospiraceae bacterium]
MSQTVEMKIIAHIHSDFPTKFGIPRQSGLVDSLKSYIVFEPEYRDENAFRGIEGYSHLWLIWQFSEAVRDTWSPTVRPPRLGGNTRMGVFATRSPFRPNAIGLSSVGLEAVTIDPKLGPVLHVTGADLMDGTPIFDIKPYLAYTDSHPEAVSNYAFETGGTLLNVDFPDELLMKIPESRRESLIAVLAQNPCPRYHSSPDRVYGMEYAGFDIGFTVSDGILTVVSIKK